METIDLTSIQNKTYKKDIEHKPLPKQPPTPSKPLIKHNDDLNDIIKMWDKERASTKKHSVKDVKKAEPKYVKEIDDHDTQTSLTENERNKIIALCQLYLAEFPEKLTEYKNKVKNLHKMSDEDLVELKQIMQKQVTTSNSLGMAVETSVKALELYEYIMCDYANINIKGVSKLGQFQEYRDCIKAVLLKYMDRSLISQVEPEYKLTYLILSNSVMCHQLNSMNETNNKIQTIEHKIESNNNSEPNTDNDIIKKLKLNNLNTTFRDL